MTGPFCFFLPAFTLVLLFFFLFLFFSLQTGCNEAETTTTYLGRTHRTHPQQRENFPQARKEKQLSL